MTPRVSVVLPTHQRAGQLSASIQSVLAQDVDLELIVVDDGSTDTTASVLEAMREPRLRVIELPNRVGAAAARNVGIAASGCDLIAFQDSDDRWLPGKLAKQLVALQDGDAVVCYTRLERVSASGRVVIPPEGLLPAGHLTTELLRRNLISTQTAVVRRSALEAVGGFDPHLPRLQDWDLWLSLARIGPFTAVDEVLVHAVDTPVSITRDVEAYFVALERILDKHDLAFALDPIAIAEHQWSLAAWALRHRRPLGAAMHLVRGARASPGRATRLVAERARKILGRADVDS